ncbi:hypothetical protein BCR36DRAFT_584387 [Piromyces finnis]|uniref:Uncharacterized protein n=1 Tax=Piromyces finnis TaxID=1754191 RepID=A0A1Y1V8L1_9FUNG|nr:hypothetical protein BCR36DRAFT_584387 [Piromyces finnis]|eukprot:ORX48465.1 hypothetical protein BCR36DRAFT_584387 [Piromyces finnis]
MQDMKDIFENYDYSKDEYYDIIEYSLIPTLLRFNKFSFYKNLNLNWSVNDTVLAYYAIKYKKYSVIQKPFFIDKLFLEGFLKNYPEAVKIIGHHFYYIPEDNCKDFFKRYQDQKHAIYRPSQYSIQFKNKKVYYELLKELLPDYPIYEKYIYGSPALIEHLNRVLNIEKVVNQAEEKKCSLKSPCSSPREDSNYRKEKDMITSHQEINKFYPYLYDYLFLFNSSRDIPKEKILKLTMNSWNCSFVSVILYDVFLPKNDDGRRPKLNQVQQLEYQKCLTNAKRMVNAYTLDDDLLQYRLMVDQNYLALENLYDVYFKILEYDSRTKGHFYRIDLLFHIFFPTIVLLIMNKDIKHLKAYISLLTYKHWIEHTLAFFDYAIEFYTFKPEKFSNQIEKLKRKYSTEYKHYKFALNQYLIK